MFFRKKLTSKSTPLPPLTVSVIAAGCLFLTTNSMADEDGLENRLDSVVVTATRSEESIGSISGKVQVIESQELNQQLQAGDNLSTALGRLIPNFGVDTQTATGATQTIRGRQPLFLIDGIPQSDNRNVSRFLNSISSNLVDRVEVITGASSVYGVGGTGGVINIITHSAAKQKEGIKFSTQVGASVSTEELASDSLNTNVSQTIAYKKDSFDAFVGFEYSQNKGAYDNDGERIAAEPAQTSINDSDIISGQLKLGWQLDDDQRIQFSYDQFDSEQDSDFGPNYGGPGVPVLFAGQQVPVVPIDGLQLDDQPKSERKGISFQYTNKDLWGSQLTALLYQRERESRFFPFAFTVDPSDILGTSFISQSTSEADVSGVKFVLDTDINSRLSLVYGIDYQRDEGKQTAIGFDANAFITSGGLDYQQINSYANGPDVDTTTLGSFAQLTFDVNEKLLLRGGLRYEKIEQDVSDYLPPFEFLLIPDGARQSVAGDTIDYDEVLVNLGAVLSLNDQQQVFFNYSQGFELPDLSRLLRDSISPNSLLTQGAPVGTVISDIELDAIKVDSYELGWRGSWDSLAASATLFYNESDKTTVFNPDFSVTQLDQDKTIYGFELAFDYAINDNWSAGMSGAYTEGETRDNQTGRDINLDAQEVAPAKLVNYLAYDFDNSSTIRLQTTTVFDYDDAQINVGGNIVDDGDIDGYTTVDLLSQWRLPKGSLSVSVANLTNRNYQTVYSQWAEATFGALSGVPARGRTLGVSYRYDY